SSVLSNDGLTTGSIRPTRNALPAERQKAAPIDNSVIFSTPDRQTRLPSRAVRTASAAGAGLGGVLALVSASLDKVELRQSATLTDLEESYDNRARHIRNVLSDLGLDAAKVRTNSATGGPYVPLKAPPAGASNFERQLYRVNVARAELTQFSQTLTAVPVRKPVNGDIDMSSPFGMRLDPFLGRPAVHTGVDLRGEVGEPVRATATGRVTIAGWDGGYGNMVELNHGNGLATRYGHLSKILVKVGQFVRIGETVGLIGSTGRSTGPHLHYETRINGEAVDPQKFLRAGVRLGSL
ncbi:MAG TPA: M23 family metallopeptidase, partial [Pseudolabrys sp.]|nr:M23 family metallopeptidase [Pseudolabrys sp.]